MRLRHLHIPNPIAYTHSLRLQEALLDQHFTYNSARLSSIRTSTSSSSSQSQFQPPNPTLLTFQSQPTYTVGRRHLKSNPLSPSQTSFLTSHDLASFHPSPRGGLLTYHAPGQLTGYLVCDLRVHGITPRCHVRVWEDSVIATAGRLGVTSGRTDDSGVWIAEPAPSNENEDRNKKDDGCGSIGDGQGKLKMTDRKLCAIGVHVSRGVTSHGVGFNVFDAPFEAALKGMYKMPTAEEISRIQNGVYDETHESDTATAEHAEGYLSWGFSRIVACGLEGKSVTWLTKEGAGPSTKIRDVANLLAQELCKTLTAKGKVQVEGVQMIQERDILGEEGGYDVESDKNNTSVLRGAENPDMKGGLEDWIGVLKGGKL